MARRRSWTDEDLIAALEGAGSLTEVVRRLRLSHGGAAFTTVRTRIELLGLAPPSGGPHSLADQTETTEARERPTRRRWTDDQLRRAVAASTSLREVFAALDLAIGGSQWAIVRARVKALGCDTSHWRYPLDPQPASSYAVATAALQQVDLRNLVLRCHSRAEVLREAGLTPSVTSYRALRDALADVEVSSDAPALRRPRGRPRRPIESILVRDSDWTNTAALRERLIDEGIMAARCARCGIETWQGEAAPLQLDHIDGNRRNNERHNLRILCANCHALTDTWCSRNRGHGGRRAGGTR